MPEGPRLRARSGLGRYTRGAILVGAILVVGGSLCVWRGQAAETGGVAISHPSTSHGKSPDRSSARTGTTKRIALTSSDLPDDCVPNPAGPPNSTYQLGLVGTAANGALSTGSATVYVNAKFCGIVTLVTGTPPCGATGSVNSPTDGQEYGPLSILLTLVPKMDPTIGLVANPGTITGGFSCSSSQNGLPVALNANVSGSTAPLFGVSCTIRATIPLTCGERTAHRDNRHPDQQQPDRAPGATHGHLPGPGRGQRRRHRRVAVVPGAVQRHVPRHGLALPAGALMSHPRPTSARRGATPGCRAGQDRPTTITSGR